jgi:protein-tyrosine phosphatase
VAASTTSGFVDIHSHILYGLDDGPDTIEQSVAMLEMARDAGTTDIVASPHANGRYAYHPDLIDARIAELSARVQGIAIHRGCDFRLQIDTIEDAVAHPRKYTIAQRGYLLVEFPDMTVFPRSDEILERLRDAGMTPIVTHPERNAHLQQHPELLAQWVEEGSLVQVTAASCTGQFGKRVKAVADALLARQLVHFIASDAHDDRFRPPDLRPAYAQLSRSLGEDRARMLFVDNPRAALAGVPIESERPVPLPRRRKWYEFWL